MDKAKLVSTLSFLFYILYTISVGLSFALDQEHRVIIFLFFLLTAVLRTYLDSIVLDFRHEQIMSGHESIKQHQTNEVNRILETMDVNAGAPGGQQHIIDIIQTIFWFPVNTRNLHFVFKSSGGEIKGKIRVIGFPYFFHFSTIANNDLPLAVENIFDKPRGVFPSNIKIEYYIDEKQHFDDKLTILLVGLQTA